MDNESAVSMPAEERDEHLDTGGTGVLSLSAGEESPHSLPVSYGYDAETPALYFRLAVGGDRSKGDLDGRAVSFVTYGEEDGWWSVVARGRLVDIEREAVASEALAGLERVDIPLVDIFEHPTREVDFEFYRLTPDELTGRVER